MNLFRSEEHARRWVEFDGAMEWTLHPVTWWAETFATPMFKARARPDFISWLGSDEGKVGWGELRERLSPPS